MVLGLNKKNIFLFDGVGGIINFLFLGVILPTFQELFGMPVNTLYFLSIFPLVYAIYSITCFWFDKNTNPIFLKIIIIANTFYFFPSLICITVHFYQLTSLGILYFIGEVLVLVGVIQIERNVYKREFCERKIARDHQRKEKVR